MRFDQILAGYADGDAISREARSFRDLFREMGFESDIFAPAGNISENMVHDARPLEDFRCSSGDMVLYHFSIGSEAAGCFAGAAGRKLVRYHNITPGEFFDGFDDELAVRLRTGRAELEGICRSADLVIADSEFNAGEVRAVGCENVKVFELVADLEEYEPDERKLDRYADGFSNILFVGRIVPNKKVEELMLAFNWINKTIDARSRLVLVGSERSCPAYFHMLKMLAFRLDLDNVCFEGFLNESELAACYCCADVFVSASRHEGYCLPLIEAMKYEVPVIARRCGGMPEALGGAGVMFDELDPVMLGELIGKTMWDGDFAGRILDAQVQRLAVIRGRDLKKEWSMLL